MEGVSPNKAKIARRVIEVLEFFDEHRGQATVMDIARRYKRPQSSTSELLAILVDMGLLYKDPASRSYMPTPRAAMLGSVAQPSIVRDGRLSALADRLVGQTGLGTAVIGTVGLDAQIFRWMAGMTPIANNPIGGSRDRLSDCAAGWLLLSALPGERQEGLFHRLRAEASPDKKIAHASLRERVQTCKREGYAVGPAGFGTTADMCAVLLPSEPGDRPMVLGFVYEPEDRIDPAGLVSLLQKSVEACIGPSAEGGKLVAPVFSAA